MRTHACTNLLPGKPPSVAAASDNVLVDYLLALRESRGGRDEGFWPCDGAVKVAADGRVVAGGA